jgi:phenylacetate-coenzyme A ligase PaaK-like adenylate-forming protein
MKRQWNDKVFAVEAHSFEATVLEIFRFQYDNNPVYRTYADAIGATPLTVHGTAQIPFLPIRFFKSHTIQSTSFSPQAIFESSGTTDTINSRHYINDIDLYKESFTRAFELFYGDVQDYCVIGLLPSYLERQNSSLIYMVNELIHQSSHPQSGFYLDEWEKLAILLKELESRQQRTLLIGVTFALLDFAEKYPMLLKHTMIMETGGMKGRRQEMIREEVHTVLKNAFGLSAIHSEYGMTELLSQAYSRGGGVFQCPPWMRIVIRDEEDPLSIKPQQSSVVSGAINIIDLANIYSCSFIATDDAGKLFPDGKFEVLGRMDNSDLRGCSLMYI